MFHRHRDIDPSTVEQAIDEHVALANQLDAEARARLSEITHDLLKHKNWEGVRPLELTDEMKIVVAANAAIPVLALDVGLYRDVSAILIMATVTKSTGARGTKARGVIASDPVDIIGQATPNGGPVMIAWDAALADSQNPHNGRNVVIHEFAHKIDMADGYTDGAPPMEEHDAEDWMTLVERAMHGPVPKHDPLRPYAWSNPAEFFAVATESFFLQGPQLRTVRPHLYDALEAFYLQDPGAVQESRG